MSENDFMKKYLAQLVGKKIVQIAKCKDPGIGTLYGLVLEGKPEKIAWIMGDPEGNGPGHLDIQEVSK